jgi:cation:H+ antiporter
VVNNAVWFAQKLGVSTFLIGASIVAIWTSLPELVATIISARKWHTDLAIWNVIGSNIFNILWIGGVSSLIRNIYFDEKYNIDLVFLMIVTIILVGVIWFSKERAIWKKVGILFVLFYIGYIIFIIFRG